MFKCTLCEREVKEIVIYKGIKKGLCIDCNLIIMFSNQFEVQSSEDKEPKIIEREDGQLCWDI